MADLERHGHVFVFRMSWGENRFDPASLAAWNAALDLVEKEVGSDGSPAALVTTGTGKFYSNGLDLDHMREQGDRGGDYLASVLEIYARVLTLPAISVAAMNGHAFGAGGQVALAHDYRVMRSGRGYFCMPEIDMRAPLHPGMTALIQAKLPAATSHEVIATGHRYAAEEALARGIVDHAVPEAEVLPRALEVATALAAKAHPAMARLKRDMYPAVLDALRQPLRL